MPLVDFFIGGVEDATEMLGITNQGHSPEALLDVARQITTQFPRIQHLAMTLRQGISANHNHFGGMLYEAQTDTQHLAPQTSNGYVPYSITHIVDRLGAGDGFTAGLIFALTTPDLSAPETAIAFATAAGCLAHSIEGDFNCSTRAEIEALMAGDVSGRVKR